MYQGTCIVPRKMDKERGSLSLTACNIFVSTPVIGCSSGFRHKSANGRRQPAGGAKQPPLGCWTSQLTPAVRLNPDAHSRLSLRLAAIQDIRYTFRRIAAWLGYEPRARAVDARVSATARLRIRTGCPLFLAVRPISHAQTTSSRCPRVLLLSRAAGRLRGARRPGPRPASQAGAVRQDLGGRAEAEAEGNPAGRSAAFSAGAGPASGG